MSVLGLVFLGMIALGTVQAPPRCMVILFLFLMVESDPLTKNNERIWMERSPAGFTELHEKTGNLLKAVTRRLSLLSNMSYFHNNKF